MVSWWSLIVVAFVISNRYSNASTLNKGSSSVDPAEAVVRRAMLENRSRRRGDFDHWLEASSLLLSMVDEYPLEAVGGLEESILAIERVTVGTNLNQQELKRAESVLSRLYTKYAAALMLLDPGLCTSLALSPYTLLLDSETASAQQPSIKLCIDNAENSLRNAASLDATNKEAEEMLANLLGTTGSDNDVGVGVHERKPEEFVAELFDNFADTFDEKLGSLQYRVPQLVGKAAELLLKTRATKRTNSETGDDDSILFESALDAGCGTGLAGRYLRPLVHGKLVGVDASKKMMNIASRCTIETGCGLPKRSASLASSLPPLYDALLQMDLEQMTIENTLLSSLQQNSDIKTTDHNNKFDLIVAADVLVYFGNLSSLMKIFQSLSGKNASLIFSCEHVTESEAPLGWRLLPSGRFAHTKDHAISAAKQAGYDLLSYESIIPRMEREQPVDGHLFMFVLSTKKNENSYEVYEKEEL